MATLKYDITVTEFKKTATAGAPLMPDIKDTISQIPGSAISVLENTYLADISSTDQLANGEVAIIMIRAKEY